VSSGSLHGVRVLDFTRYLAGPFCTMQLADHGADVIKVESKKGRELRTPGSTRDSYFFLSANRGKRSLVVDIKQPAGRDLLLRLLPSFDVVVENFRPGVMDALGLGPSALSERWPRLVYCSISGYGPEGPYRDRPGFDQVAQGMSGFMSVTGTAEQGPTRAGIAIADLLAGIFASQGIALALYARERSGRGQVLTTSLLESMVGVMSWAAGMYFDSDSAPGPAGQHHPLASPYGRFRARDGYLNIAAGNDGMWGKLVVALDRPALADDPRFASPGARIKNRAALTTELETTLAARPVAAWVDLLNGAGIPTGPVLDMAQVFADPQVLARQMLVELPHPEIGTFKTTGLPVKLAGTPAKIERRPPLLGEHTDEVLREYGVSAEEIAALRHSGIVGV
jgi:crotonobetainyl-CoA:carnitine CoA-transferase CaiB-like acyl-CoA transferase